MWEVYYLLYADDYEIPSKVAFDPEEPSLGRIRSDSIAPPHALTSIKRCISRVERNPSLASHADLFAGDTPLKEGHISILHANGPGLSHNETIAVVLSHPPIPNEPIAVVLSPPIPDGKYVIKNRGADLFWNAVRNPITTVHFSSTTMEYAKESNSTFLQVDEHSPIIQLFRR